jgi:hypothetical protein
MAPPTAAERGAAEELRAEGNKLFGRGKFSAAADRYTEAITLDPANAALFVNRALCSKKAGGAWSRVEADAARALELDAYNLKAHYLMGGCCRSRQGSFLESLKGGLEGLTGRAMGHRLCRAVHQNMACAACPILPRWGGACRAPRNGLAAPASCMLKTSVPAAPPRFQPVPQVWHCGSRASSCPRRSATSPRRWRPPGKRAIR